MAYNKTGPRKERPILEGITHGRSGYARGCGCDVCRGAEREYQQQRKAMGLQPRNGRSVRDPRSKQERQIEAKATKLRVINGGGDDDGEDDTQQSAPKRKGKAMGATEEAVVEECGALSIAVERPAMVMQARSLARILDDEKQIGLWPTTSRMLTQILNDLRGNSKKKSKGRLARVQGMTKGSGAVG